MDIKIFDDGYDITSNQSNNNRFIENNEWSDVMEQIIDGVCDEEDDIEDDFEFMEEMLTTHDDFADRVDELLWESE